jgi:tetratricopeptide (TPR) repeat protein
LRESVGDFSKAIQIDPKFVAAYLGRGSAHHALSENDEALSDLATAIELDPAPGAIVYACIDWRHMTELLAAGEGAAFELLNLCVRVNTNGGMGSLYRSRHELVFVFRNGREAHRNKVQLGRFGRNRTNVWKRNFVDVDHC